MESKTGIELIAEERREQIEKHGRTIELDAELYSHITGNSSQLTQAADTLTAISISEFGKNNMPRGWNKEIWFKMVNKPYMDRLIIAGALIAAEIDRLNHLNNGK